MKLLLTLTLLFNFVFGSTDDINTDKLTQKYLSMFKEERYKINMQKKIDKLNTKTKEVFLKSFQVGLPYIKDTKQQTKFALTILTFFDKYHSKADNSEKYAKIIAQKFVNLPSEFTNLLVELGKENDENLKRNTENLNQINELLERIVKLK